MSQDPVMMEKEQRSNIDPSQIVELLKERKRILCIGDLVIDVVFKGERHELESLKGMPSPPHIAREYKAVLDCNSFNVYPGGAAGLAYYLQTLGNEVTLISTYGWGDEKYKIKCSFTKLLVGSLINLLKEVGVDCNSLVITKERPTPIKIYAYYQITEVPYFEWAPRIDLEGRTARACINNETTYKLLEKMSNLAQFDAVVIEDNAKGLLSQVNDEMAKPSPFAQGIAENLKDTSSPIFVDPRSQWDFFRSLKVQAVLPDHCFATRAAKCNPAHLPENRDQLMKVLAQHAEVLFQEFGWVDNFVIKCGQHGVFAVLRDKTNRWKADSGNMQSWKVSACSTVGCGDVFDAYYISLVLRKLDPWLAIQWANLAGGLRAERGMGFFPDASHLKEYLDELSQSWPSVKKVPFESKVSKIMERFKPEINLDECVLVKTDNANIIMARDGVMLKTACKIIKELQESHSKVLLYGQSRSGKGAIISVVAHALSLSSERIKSYSEMRGLSKKTLKENDVLIFKDVEEISALLSLGEQWQFKNRKGETVDLSKQRIIFDVSLVTQVEEKRSDLSGRGIKLFHHHHLGENKDVLIDAAFFIGYLLSNANLSIETRVFAALLSYHYCPGEGWNKLKDMVEQAIYKAKERNGDCVTKDDFQDSISDDDDSRITVSCRVRKEDNLLDICDL